MKRLLFPAVMAGLCLAGAAAQADHFRLRYKVQYSGGAYLGYPSSTKYSVNYYPMIAPGPANYNLNGVPTTDANGNPVYPRAIGQGYTVNAYPGPYTSYSYKFQQRYQYPRQKEGADQVATENGTATEGTCNTCNPGNAAANSQPSGEVIIHNRLHSGGQRFHQSYSVTPHAPVQNAPVTPVTPKENGTIVPAPAPSQKVAPPAPKASAPKAAHAPQNLPVLTAEAVPQE